MGWGRPKEDRSVIIRVDPDIGTAGKSGVEGTDVVLVTMTSIGLTGLTSPTVRTSGVAG